MEFWSSLKTWPFELCATLAFHWLLKIVLHPSNCHAKIRFFFKSDDWKPWFCDLCLFSFYNSCLYLCGKIDKKLAARKNFILTFSEKSVFDIRLRFFSQHYRDLLIRAFWNITPSSSRQVVGNSLLSRIVLALGSRPHASLRPLPRSSWQITLLKWGPRQK